MSVTTRPTTPSFVCSACRSAVAVAVGLCLRCYACRVREEREEEEVSEDGRD